MDTEHIEIWHNPRCSKSRATLALLQERGLEPKIRLYLQDPPDPATLDRVLRLLGQEPREFMRTDEAHYLEEGLDDPARTRQELLAAMSRFPVLIQRPVVILGQRAAVGRPPEAVLGLFD